MQEYRGIKLADSVKLYKKDGSYNIRTKNALDKLSVVLEESKHKILSVYFNDKTKILIDFNCGHEPNLIQPFSYKNGVGCPKCADLKKGEEKKINSKLEFEETIKSNNHKLLVEYEVNYKKVLIDFNCGHEPHWITPYDYKNGRGCPKCCGTCPIEAEKNFNELLNKNGHSLLTKYINSKTKTLIDFNCGHKPHWISPSMYKRGKGCPMCKKVSKEQAKEELQMLVEKNKHRLLSEYESAHKKVLIDFQCGHKPHLILPYAYKTGQGCPRCSESKGEKIIREWLKNEKVLFKTQYIFPSQTKRYDFCLPNDNLIVEVHGRQHYEENDFFNARTLEEEQENDRLKEEYARSQGYNYMVVDYREHDPKLALERFKKQYADFKEKN